jgi:hypothetical protein
MGQGSQKYTEAGGQHQGGSIHDIGFPPTFLGDFGYSHRRETQATLYPCFLSTHPMRIFQDPGSESGGGEERVCNTSGQAKESLYLFEERFSRREPPCWGERRVAFDDDDDDDDGGGSGGGEVATDEGSGGRHGGIEEGPGRRGRHSRDARASSLFYSAQRQDVIPGDVRGALAVVCGSEGPRILELILLPLFLLLLLTSSSSSSSSSSLPQPAPPIPEQHVPCPPTCDIGPLAASRRCTVALVRGTRQERRRRRRGLVEGKRQQQVKGQDGADR